MKSKNYFIGNESTKPIKMQAGKYVYTFACVLPNHIPESLKICNNKIEYKVEALLHIPWTFDKKKCAPFTIVRNDSLMGFPALQHPMQLENENSFCCLCCKKGVCTMGASIPQSVFTVGQMIPIKIECQNLSTVDIKDITIKIIQEQSCTSSTPKDKTKSFPSKCLNKAGVEGVKSGGILESREVLIQVPSNSNRSNETYCKVVTVNHFLEVRCKTSWYHRDLLVRFPITII